MMEIVYGPLLLACAIKSAAFGILLALAGPGIAAAVTAHVAAPGLMRRIGLGLLGGGLFGLAHLAIVCASDGSPPRIIQSMGAALMVLALLGLTALVRGGRALRAA